MGTREGDRESDARRRWQGSSERPRDAEGPESPRVCQKTAEAPPNNLDSVTTAPNLCRHRELILLARAERPRD